MGIMFLLSPVQEGCGENEVGLAEGYHEDTEHISCNKRLWELSLFIQVKRRIKSNLIVLYSCLKGC